MAQIRIDLNEEELRDLARQVNDIAAVLDDSDDVETIGQQLELAIGAGESVFEWVAQAKATLARQGIAA